MKLTVERDAAGKIIGAYFQIEGRQVDGGTFDLARTKRASVRVDKDRHGRVLGIEFTGPIVLIEQRVP